MVKNEHIIYAYGEIGGEPGKYLLLIGITDHGAKTLREKLTLTIGDLPNLHFSNVVIYQEKDKAALKELLRKSGIPVSEKH